VRAHSASRAIDIRPENGVVETLACRIPMTDHPVHPYSKQHLFIRSIDESISHDVRLTSSIGGFSG
jgi:hypothetical protein